MKIKISGSGGYIGSIVSDELKKKGHQPEGINRDLLYSSEEKLAGVLNRSDVVIHLAGAPILRRWTEENKKLILDSRVETAKNLARAINQLPAESRPRKVVSASGISLYAAGKSHTEKSTDYDTGFLGEVVQQWEKAWELLPHDVELTIFRMAPLLGKESPAIQKMKFPFKMGVGGTIGSGKQPFPFVHEADVARAYLWAIENNGTAGKYILAAPHEITNAYFTRALADAMNRPAFTTVPALALKVIYGQAATMLLHSPSVYPEKLLDKGFQFKYDSVEKTLQQIVHQDS